VLYDRRTEVKLYVDTTGKQVTASRDRSRRRIRTALSGRRRGRLLVGDQVFVLDETAVR
jgi:hypothetical protein